MAVDKAIIYDQSIYLPFDRRCYARGCTERRQLRVSWTSSLAIGYPMLAKLVLTDLCTALTIKTGVRLAVANADYL